jgi:predicted PurR-regulated permease PerM
MDKDFFKKTIELIIRVAALGLLSVFCYLIFEPFIIPLLWGIIIAVGIYPIFKRVKKFFRGNRFWAATLIVTLFLAIMAVPTVLLTKSFVDGATDLAQHLQEHKIEIPPPTAAVKEWPIIGVALYDFWNGFSINLSKAVSHLGPSLQPVGIWAITHLTKAGIDILLFTISIVLAGIFLYYETEGKEFIHKFATRLAGENGKELVDITGATVRNVTGGILSLAVIQGILAGIGLLVAQVPVAGLWAFLVLVLAVIQLPPLFVLGPVAIYIFSYGDTTVAVLFLIWSIFLSVVDTPLRVLFMGRGTVIPMPIIFFGAMGGMIQGGIIGLFIGAVVLSLGYKFFLYWLKET